MQIYVKDNRKTCLALTFISLCGLFATNAARRGELSASIDG